ncbi:MAG: chaperone NapD [Candidatus Marinimicrobia bacterium]|nr:chaperone NapD [Candidatus Neomarinimicrobiota bacterium]
MPIAGVVVLTVPEKTNEILLQLNKIKNVTTYGVHKENFVVAVFEGETPNELEGMSDRIIKTIPGVLGIYPAYVNFEDIELQEDEEE